MIISKRIIIFSMCIIVSASFTRQISDLFIKLFGQTVLNVCIWTLFVLAGLYLFSHAKELWKNKKFVNILITSLILIIALFYALTFEFMIERIHLVLFGSLGFIVIKDNYRTNKLKAILITLFYCFVVVCIDELFQYFLPYRYGDPRDLVFGTIGSTFGIALYISLIDRRKEFCHCEE